MTSNPHAAAAREETLGRLAAYRERRETLHSDIRRAAELDISTTDIAKTSGLSWHGVNKILNRNATKEITMTTIVAMCTPGRLQAILADEGIPSGGIGDDSSVTLSYANAAKLKAELDARGIDWGIQ